jgi:hypothetical protein
MTEKQCPCVTRDTFAQACLAGKKYLLDDLRIKMIQILFPLFPFGI